MPAYAPNRAQPIYLPSNHPASTNTTTGVSCTSTVLRCPCSPDLPQHLRRDEGTRRAPKLNGPPVWQHQRGHRRVAPPGVALTGARGALCVVPSKRHVCGAQRQRRQGAQHLRNRRTGKRKRRKEPGPSERCLFYFCLLPERAPIWAAATSPSPCTQASYLCALTPALPRPPPHLSCAQPCPASWSQAPPPLPAASGSQSGPTPGSAGSSGPPG